MDTEKQRKTGGAEQNALTDGPLFSGLMRFTVPFLLSNLLQTLYGTVDTLVIGNYGSSSGVSAVACGAQLLSLFTFLAIGLSAGGTVLVSQCIGAKDHRQAAGIVGNLIIDFAAVSVVLTALSAVFSPVFLSWLNVPAEAMAEAVTYMRVCSFGIPLIIGYNIVCALLRAMGDSKSPLIFVAVACAINVAGDLLLTGALGLGVAGVAIATVAAQGVSFVFSLVFIMKKGMPFAFGKADIRFDRKTSAGIFRIGVPMGVQSVLINVSFMFITAIINSLGLAASAAMGIGEKIVSFTFMPQSAFSASAAVVVAQNYGAGKMDRARRAVGYAIAVCFAIEAVFFLICILKPEFMPSLFTREEQVVKMAGRYMMAYSIDGMLTAVAFNLSALLNGCGKTAFNMTQNLIATFLGRIPATWLFSRIAREDLFLIGCAAPASTVLSIIMLLVYIRLRLRGTGT
ncbi:MAG: MATE family efflux transporter, partial [Clostridia bacterium]|nr:MATE family efflux transporter [Clostridia bacterium]